MNGISRLFMKVAVVVLFFAVGVVWSAPNAQTISEYEEWASDKDITAKYSLAELPGYGYGGKALVDIEPGEVLVSVARNLVVNSDTVIPNSPLENFENWSGVLDSEKLVLWLLMETQNPKSEWKEYLDIIPSSYPSHPLSWTEEELDALKGTGLDIATRNRRASLRRVFNYYSEEFLPAYTNFYPVWSFERFVWAYQTVNSRTWSLESENGERLHSMVPIADMLNHHPGYGVGTLSWDKDYFIINATKPVAKGEQVFNNYGTKSNYDLLNAYGFVIEDNEYDHVLVQYQMKNKSPLVNGLLSPFMELMPDGFDKIKLLRDQPPFKLLTLCRLAEMEYHDINQAEKVLQGEMISIENEVHAMRNAIGSLSKILSLYSSPDTTEDQELLVSGGLSYNIRTAITLRKLQKEIVHANIDAIRHLWDKLLLTL